MRRIAIIAATLLVSAFGAQAAPQKVLRHPAHRWVAGNPAGIGGLSTASLPLGYKAIVDDSINALQRGSAHPRAHDSACMARQNIAMRRIVLLPLAMRTDCLRCAFVWPGCMLGSILRRHSRA